MPIALDWSLYDEMPEKVSVFISKDEQGGLSVSIETILAKSQDEAWTKLKPTTE